MIKPFIRGFQIAQWYDGVELSAQRNDGKIDFVCIGWDMLWNKPREETNETLINFINGIEERLLNET